ncbi:MAG TPA: DUF4340 domain-containing protein, partial [Nitrospiria bacterium]|nr:DUF4340 domain-containing protein [Nitrospiria bacterium]
MHLLSPRNPTLILAAVFLILGAYLYFFELPDKNAREEAGLNETRVLDVTADSIETIIIRHPEEEIHLEKQGPEDWTIRRPLETEADAQEVRGLISTLVDLRHERIVEETGAEAAEFGLDHPFLEVVLESSDRSETIRIGDDAPVGGAVFLDRGSDGRVVTVQKWVQGALTRTAFDLREKTILSFTPERIDGIKLQFPEHTLTFEKKPDGWEVTDPVQAPGDPETFTALLNALQNLRADAFIDPGEAYDQTMTTLTTPLVEISLREGTRVHQARIFDSPDREKVQVLRAETDPVFGTPRFIMDSLQAEPFHYQDKHLVFFDPGQVLKVEVRGPLEQYTLTRGDGGWKLDGSDEAIHVHL